MNGIDITAYEALLKERPEEAVTQTDMTRYYLAMRVQELHEHMMNGTCPVGQKLKWTWGVMIGGPAFILALIALLKMAL